MTPKEKAKELVFKKFGCSKQYALIAVNELIKETGAKYWYDVKQEIESL